MMMANNTASLDCKFVNSCHGVEECLVNVHLNLGKMAAAKNEAIVAIWPHGGTCPHLNANQLLSPDESEQRGREREREGRGGGVV